jgi:hypothetical protein
LAGPERDGEEVGLKEGQGLNEEAGFHGHGGRCPSFPIQ